MELPIKCKACDREQMVETDTMPKRVVSNLVQVEGFFCECGVWNDWFFSTRSLSEQMEKLENLPVTHRNFLFFFKKVLRKALGIQKRIGENG